MTFITITELLFVIGGIFIAYLFYSIIIKPYLLIRFYRKQGILMDFLPGPGIMYQSMQNVKKHGDFAHRWKEVTNMKEQQRVFGGNVANDIQLFLVDNDIIKDFIRKQDLYVKHPKFCAIFRELMAEGLVFSEKNVWKRHRKYDSMAFHYDFLTSVIPGVIKIVDEFLENAKKGDMSRFNAKEEFEAITGELVGRIFFGEKFSEYRINGKSLTRVLGDLLARVGVETFSPLTLIFGAKLMKLGLFKYYREMARDIKEFKAFCKGIIEIR